MLPAVLGYENLDLLFNELVWVVHIALLIVEASGYTLSVRRS